MKFRGAFSVAALVAALYTPTQAVLADDLSGWDGAWKGTFGKKVPWPISLSVEKGQVVAFAERGTPFDVRFTKATPTTLEFGDNLHYEVKLTKTGAASATAKVHGRRGVVAGVLTKE